MARLGGLLALATLLVALLPVTAASARRPGPVVGIGEQKPGMFDSKHWQRTGFRHARYTVPWDALRDPHQLQLLDTWIAAAKRSDARVLLGFGRSLRSRPLANTLPSKRQYERQFRRFRERYPQIRDWLTWNEANNPGALTARRPRRVAQYFDAVARNCGGCRIVAADVLDTSNMAAWVRGFQRHARTTPRIWGLHNYGDTTGLKVHNTQRLLALTRGKIWFTETGGVVLRRLYRGGKVLRTYRYSLTHAARSTRHALRLACISARITRVYLYHWQAPPTVTSWDSGLFDGLGRPRPAFFALRRQLAQPAMGTRSEGRRSTCPERGRSSKPRS